MAYEFKLPDLGEGLTEGEIVKWLVKVGDFLEEGQTFVQVETDKAVIEIPSPKKGMVLQILAKVGEAVQVGQVIVVIGEPGEKIEPAAEAKGVEKPASVGVVGELEEAAEEVEERVPERPPEPQPAKVEVLATPAVRKFARELKVELSGLKGSGPRGRITKEDVQKTAEGQEEAPAVEVKAARKYDMYGFIERVPLRGMRKTIAKAMAKSKSTAAHVTTIDEADITNLVTLREKEKDRAAKRGIHLTYMPFLIKAAVAALEEHPFLNASLEDETGEIILKKYFNIGVAVDTKDGLMVPVVKNAKEKSILALADELLKLSEKARERTIDLADLKGGTFTITNYGAVGGIYGSPIINYPEVAILGVGKILEKPVVIDGTIEIRKVLPLSLSFDHRVIDGAEAARFMNTVIDHLEDPDLILLEG
ncbi:MAG: 2-oxo acid dehydrogenase subunit E2 [Proteobacteria bacterium]|nr:2-oxo acid dehydrogenase subunit E2 [Pseudomonadota bacterium]NIS67991.1 2-oxo acid dehydrogenase subunit E2 [Pseudomonadota bacterium]